MRRILLAAAAVAFSLTAAAPALAQQPDPAPVIAAQKAAMAPLSLMDGVWRGTAWQIEPSGKRIDLTQTERVGPFLDGTLKVVEGRGYLPDGSIGFNAFAIVSYDPAKKTYTMRSYTGGRHGDFPFEARDDGFTWSIPLGPKAMVRYTATIKDGTWVEIGDLLAEGQPPRKFFEMRLKRISDGDWPAAGAVPMAGPKGSPGCNAALGCD